MFFRIISRDGNGAEVLYNTNQISKIEVVYSKPDDNGETLWSIDVVSAQSDPDAVRSYRVHVGGDTILLMARSGDPVVQIFEDIYKDSVKA